MKKTLLITLLAVSGNCFAMDGKNTTQATQNFEKDRLKNLKFYFGELEWVLNELDKLKKNPIKSHSGLNFNRGAKYGLSNQKKRTIETMRYLLDELSIDE